MSKPQNPPDTSSSLDSKLSRPLFDPVDFLNEALPSINLSSQTQAQKGSRSIQIQSVSTDTIALLSTLNAHNVRSSSELTSLTDEIIRGGNRLAYEVEVLRGDVNGLHELLTETLREEIGLFVGNELLQQTLNLEDKALGDIAEDATQGARTPNNDPDFIIQLRTLGKVKARLEAVVTIFGEAMKWTMPPSDMASSLISVSAPELGIQYTEEDDKAREVLRSIRGEISDLLNSESGGYPGMEAASRRADEYRQLALLWKGTSEEKARARFVETLIKMVEDRKRSLDTHKISREGRLDGSQRPGSAMGRISKVSSEVGGAAGLFRNLQRFKDDLYLE